MKVRVSAAAGLGSRGSASRSREKVLGIPEPSISSPITTSQVCTRCWSRNATRRESLFLRWLIQAFVSTRITGAPRPSVWWLARSTQYHRQRPNETRRREPCAHAAPARSRRSSSRQDGHRPPPPAALHSRSASYAQYASVQCTVLFRGRLCFVVCVCQ